MPKFRLRFFKGEEPHEQPYRDEVIEAADEVDARDKAQKLMGKDDKRVLVDAQAKAFTVSESEIGGPDELE